MLDIDAIRRRADAGCPQSQWQVYHYFVFKQQPGRARRYLRRAEGCWQIAAVTGSQPELEVLRRAQADAADNSLPALHYLAVVDALEGNLGAALDHWRAAAELGCECAKSVLRLPLPLPERTAAAHTCLAEQPAIDLYSGFLPPLLCRWLVALAEPHLEASLTWDANGQAVADPIRTSDSMTFMPWLVEPGVAAIQRHIAAQCGLPLRHCESLGLLRYQPGQRYFPHYDAFALDQPGSGETLADGGQRIRTALVYLNDGYRGGGTAFVKLDLEVRGEMGDLLVFDNTDAGGVQDAATLHEGQPVEEGTKYLLSQWFRQDRTRYTNALGL